MSITLSDLKEQIQVAESMKRSIEADRAADHTRRMLEAAEKLQADMKDLQYNATVEPLIQALTAIEQRKSLIDQTGTEYRHSGGTRTFKALLLKDGKTIRCFEALFRNSLLLGDSGPSRPRFRRDGDRRSDLMPTGIPAGSRPLFR